MLAERASVRPGALWSDQIRPGPIFLQGDHSGANYRNMIYIIRDRIRDLKQKGRTLDQVKAAKPTMDYDGRWGATTGPWTTDMFLEAVYRTLK